MRLTDFFDKAAQASPEASAVWHEGTYWSYRQIQELSFQFAHALMAQAMPAGARVASWLPNHPLFFVIQIGVHRTPFQWLPLNPRATAACHVHVRGGVAVHSPGFRQGHYGDPPASS